MVPSSAQEGREGAGGSWAGLWGLMTGLGGSVGRVVMTGAGVVVGL
jgi:hypothetical protein